MFSDSSGSLADLLDGLDDDDENETTTKRTEQATFSTLDSVQQQKREGKTSKRGGKRPKSPTKRGPTKKTESSSSLSLTGGPPPPMSLSAGLTQLGSLQRQDFGRGEDDEDTFCGEKEMQKKTPAFSSNIPGKQLKHQSKATTTNPLMGRPASSSAFGGNPFGNAMKDDDDSEEEDLFADSSNPFRMYG